MADEGERLVCVGAVAGAFGVAGEARVKSFCAEPEAIGDYGPLLAEDGREIRLRITRPVKGGFAARLSGVTTREEAEALKGTRLYVPRARLPEPEEDEFYHADLIGLEAVDPGGARLGRVKAVQDWGAGDLLEIAQGGGKSVLIPFTRDVVPTVDLAGGRIVVDPPEGILEREESQAMTAHHGRESPKHLFARIREVLLREWDPMGLSDAPGEPDDYDAAAREVHALLTDEEATVERIAHYLEWAEDELMGLQRRPEAARRAAERIMALREEPEGPDRPGAPR